MILRTALNLIHFESRWARPAIMITGGTVIFMLQRWIGESMWLQFGVAFVALGGLVMYWIVYAWIRKARGADRLLPPYRWLYVSLGFAMSGLACSLYVTEMLSHRLYWAIHSVWHIDAALGQFFILLAWPPNKGIRNFESQAFLAKFIENRAAAALVPVAQQPPRHHQAGGQIVHRTPASKF
mgnify:CR=1 FL=1